MKLGLITQIRNEIDIIESFLKHIDALFDIVFLLDHQSIDGTTDLLKQAASQKQGWNYYLLDFKGNYQKEIAKFFVYEAFKRDIDYLFFLDADEFILTQNRKTLEAKLSKFSNHNLIGELRWFNCLPKYSNLSTLNFDTPLSKSSHPSYFKKAIIPKSCYELNPKLSVSAGNHSVHKTDLSKIPGIEIGNLIHIPIRSKAQILQKAIIWGINLAVKNEASQGSHFQYNEFLSKIARDDLDGFSLMRFTHIYETPRSRYDSQESIKKHWKNAPLTSLEQLSIACNPSLILGRPKKELPLYAIIADALISHKSKDLKNVEIVLNEGIIRLVEKEKPETLKNSIINKKQLFRIKELETLNNKRKFELQQANCKIKSYENERGHLLLDLAIKEQEIQFYACSKSWRITRPLRKLMQFFNSIFKKLTHK